MKRAFIAVVSAALLTGVYSFIPAKKTEDSYGVSVAESKVTWVGSKKAGYHTGYFNLKGGNVIVENGKLAGGKFVIDLTSVKTTDGTGEKLEGHLKSPDFFDVAKFGEATYEIKSVKYSSASTADVTGNLTLKGVTLPVNFTANIRNLDDKKFFGQANFTIDRTLFGVNYGVGMVSNDVQIGVYLFANK